MQGHERVLCPQSSSKKRKQRRNNVERRSLVEVLRAHNVLQVASSGGVRKEGKEENVATPRPPPSPPLPPPLLCPSHVDRATPVAPHRPAFMRPHFGMPDSASARGVRKPQRLHTRARGVGGAVGEWGTRFVPTSPVRRMWRLRGSRRDTRTHTHTHRGGGGGDGRWGGAGAGWLDEGVGTARFGDFSSPRGGTPPHRHVLWYVFCFP